MLVVATLFAFTLGSISQARLALAQSPATQQRKVDAFLSRLQLNELRLHLLRQQLATLTDAAEREVLAVELASLYASALASPSSDKARERLTAEVNQLLRDFPKAASVSLELQLLEADYQRAEAAVLAWLETPEDAEAKAKGQLLLSSTADRFTRVVERLGEQNNQLTAREDTAASDSEREQIDQQFATNQQLIQRGNYFVGWSRYYLAITQLQTGAADQQLALARRAFGEILSIPEEDTLREIAPNSLLLESIWRTRAAIGLAMTEQALGEEERASTIFGWLAHTSVPTQLRDQRHFWQLQGMLNADQYAAAVRLAEAMMAAPLERPTTGVVSFWGAAARSGMRREAASTADQQRLAELSIARLAQLRQFELIDELLAKYPAASVASSPTLYSLLVAGRRAFLAAEKSKQKPDYEQALATLVEAINHPDAAGDLHAAGQCRYYAGWCEFRLEHYEPAANWLEQSASALADIPTLAAQALWLAALSYQQLIEKDPAFATKAAACIARLERDYPAAEQLAKAKILRTKLLESPATAEQVLRDLAAIAPSDAGYRDARYEITQVHYRRWQHAQTKRIAAAEFASQQQTAAEEYLATNSKSDDSQRLQVSLQWLEIYASLHPSMSADEIAAAQKILREISQPAVESVAATSPLVSEFHYRSLQIAAAANQLDEALVHAQWLDTQAPGSTYQLPALTILARAADEQLERASATDQPARLAEATSIYERLLKLMGGGAGSGSGIVASNRNAAVASSRLARYYELAGNFDQSRELLQSLVDAYPEEQKYLVRLAQAESSLGNLAAALPIWNRILSGTKSGSETWFEAKYQQLVCLLGTDRAQAQKTWSQFRVLYPTISSARWKVPFEQLDAQFRPRATAEKTP